MKPGDEGLTPQAALARLLESKREQRRKLAALPFAEKFRMVVEMRRLSDAVPRLSKKADDR
ncbi:MAG TPA: hypothetical protein VGH20_03145 [Myxococcales bacterium]